MRPKTLFLTAGVLGLLFGLAFLVAPAALLPAYGVQAEAPTVLMSRFFGAALIHLGLVLYLLREVRDPGIIRGLALAGVAGSLGGLAVALSGVLGGVVNALGWSTVAIYGFLLLGYATCLPVRRVVA